MTHLSVTILQIYIQESDGGRSKSEYNVSFIILFYISTDKNDHNFNLDKLRVGKLQPANASIQVRGMKYLSSSVLFLCSTSFFFLLV